MLVDAALKSDNWRSKNTIKHISNFVQGSNFEIEYIRCEEFVTKIVFLFLALELNKIWYDVI